MNSGRNLQSHGVDGGTWGEWRLRVEWTPGQNREQAPTLTWVMQRRGRGTNKGGKEETLI